MLNSTPPAYARLPTFSAVIDSLASGLGIVRNKDDSLVQLYSFSGRIDVYSGLPHRTGLEEKLLELLAGSDKTLRRLVQERLLEAEAALTNARAFPLVTKKAEVEGLECFIKIWAVPWVAQVLVGARQHPESVLDSARQLIERYADTLTDEPTTFLSFWKSSVRKAIPAGIESGEFRTTLTRLDQRSKRKNESIEQDLASLRVEMRNSHLSPQELESTIRAIRQLYLAGMATMRLCSLAVDIISEQDLLALVFNALISVSSGKYGSPEELGEKQRAEYWRQLDPLMVSDKYRQLSELDFRNVALKIDKLRENLRKKDPVGLLMPAIDFVEGNWNFFHGQVDSAKHHWERVVASSNNRQLGEVTAYAVSFLVALRISENDAIKFKELNPLVRVKIDNSPQLNEILLDITPTPFSNYSSRPKPSFYDSCLIECVASFNRFSRSLNISTICNPIARFDEGVEKLIIQSRNFGAKMTEKKRKLPAIVGTSVKSYQLLRDHFYYIDGLFTLNWPFPPGMTLYMTLPQHDQLRVLRFVNPVQFQADLKAHGITEWHHPDDIL